MGGWIDWIWIYLSPPRGKKKMVNILIYYIFALVKESIICSKFNKRKLVTPHIYNNPYPWHSKS